MALSASFFLGAALVASVATALPARAADTKTQTVLVRIGDLDLTTDTGVDKAHDRIAVAARQVCSRDDGRDVAHHSQYLDCRKTAIDDASTRLQAIVASIRSNTEVASLPVSDYRAAMDRALTR